MAHAHPDQIKDDDWSSVELEEMIKMSSGGGEKGIARSDVDRRLVVPGFLAPIDGNRATYLDIRRIAGVRSPVSGWEGSRRIQCRDGIRHEERGRQGVCNNLLRFNIVCDEALSSTKQTVSVNSTMPRRRENLTSSVTPRRR